MIGMSQIRKRLIYGILIGLAVGIIGIIIAVVWSISVINSYKDGTNEEYIANYTTVVTLLNRDVIQGETITADMLTTARVHIKSAPLNQIGDGAIGKIAKYNIPANIPIVDSMFGTEIVTKDERIQEVSSVALPTGLVEGDYIDIKIKMASGLEYVVIPQIKVRKIMGNTIQLYLNEEDLYYLNSAIVDTYLTSGAAELYAVRYVDPTTQINLGDTIEKENGEKISITDQAKRDLVKKIEEDVANGTVALTIPEEVTNNTTTADTNTENEEVVTENIENEDTTVNDENQAGLTQEYINFTDNLTELLLKYAIEYRYYIESYAEVKRTYQPSDIIMAHMRENEYITEEAKEKLDTDLRRKIEENIENFMASSGEQYETAVSGLANQIATQQSLRSSTLSGNE